MTGRAVVTGLAPSVLEPMPAVQFDNVSSLGADAKRAGPRAHYRTDGWMPLQPSPKLPSTSADHFGLELTFGRTLAERWPGQPLAIIKHGRGGTSLAEDWAVGAVSGLMLYRQFLAQVQAALGRLRAAGTAYEVAALVWAQGEADATRQNWAEHYQVNLEQLVARMRADLAVPDLPVFLVLTGDGKKNFSMHFAAQVRAAQSALSAADPRIGLVSGDDLTLLDAVHYDAASQLTLGRRAAEAYLALTAAGSP